MKKYQRNMQRKGKEKGIQKTKQALFILSVKIHRRGILDLVSIQKLKRVPLQCSYCSSDNKKRRHLHYILAKQSNQNLTNVNWIRQTCTHCPFTLCKQRQVSCFFPNTYLHKNSNNLDVSDKIRTLDISLRDSKS